MYLFFHKHLSSTSISKGLVQDVSGNDNQQNILKNWVQNLAKEFSFQFGTDMTFFFGQ